MLFDSPPLTRRWRLPGWGVGLMLLAGTSAAEPKAQARDSKIGTTTARFVAVKPPAATQTSKSVGERGGLNPGNVADPGFGQ